MKITIEIDDALLSRVLEAAADTELESGDFICQFLENNLPHQGEKDTHALEDLANEAVDFIKTHVTGRGEFLMSQYISDIKRMKLTPGERKQLGKVFRKRLEAEGVGKFVRRRHDNHAIYERTI